MSTGQPSSNRLLIDSLPVVLDCDKLRSNPRDYRKLCVPMFMGSIHHALLEKPLFTKGTAALAWLLLLIYITAFD